LSHSDHLLYLVWVNLLYQNNALSQYSKPAAGARIGSGGVDRADIRPQAGSAAAGQKRAMPRTGRSMAFLY